MKIKLTKMNGEVIKDNDTYVIEDNNYLEHLTISQTTLKMGQMTKGHMHENQEEVYTFTSGEAFMQIGEVYHHATDGDTFLVKAGEFHRVFNKSITKQCSFTCIFEKYDRNGTDAKYQS